MLASFDATQDVMRVSVLTLRGVWEVTVGALLYVSLGTSNACIQVAMLHWQLKFDTVVHVHT